MDPSMDSVVNDLELYMSWSSIHCQKVRFVLNLKKLDYTIRVVDLDNYEHLEPDYLHLNPNGTVPTLKLASKVIGDSEEIVKYLDGIYEPKLLDINMTDPNADTIQYLVSKLDNIQIDVITIGAFLHPELTENTSRVSPDVIKLYQSNVRQGTKLEKLQENLTNYPLMKNIYLTLLKIEKQKIVDCIYSVDNVLNAIQAANDIIVEIEDQLDQTRAENGGRTSWIVGGRISLADIMLTVLLFRLQCVGFSKAIFQNGQLPLMDQYFQFVKSNLPDFRTICVNFKREPAISDSECKKHKCSIL